MCVCASFGMYVVRTLPAKALNKVKELARSPLNDTLARRSMHLCLHSCSSHWAVRHSFRLTCPWPTARPGPRCQRDLRRCASPTTAVLSPARPQLRLPGVGDIRNLNIDLGDVPDGRYREVEVIRMSHMIMKSCRVGAPSTIPAVQAFLL